MARRMCFLLGFIVYLFLRKTGPGIPLFGYWPILYVRVMRALYVVWAPVAYSSSSNDNNTALAKLLLKTEVSSTMVYVIRLDSFLCWSVFVSVYAVLQHQRRLSPLVLLL